MAYVENAELIEVLKVVALESLSKINVPQSSWSGDKAAATQESYETLEASLVDPRQTELLEEFDAAYNELLTSEANDNYINGFIQGYLFFKKHQEKNLIAGNDKVTA